MKNLEDQMKTIGYAIMLGYPDKVILSLLRSVEVQIQAIKQLASPKERERGR